MQLSRIAPCVLTGALITATSGFVYAGDAGSGWATLVSGVASGKPPSDSVLWGGAILARQDIDGKACTVVGATPLDARNHRPQFEGPATGANFNPRFAVCGDEVAKAKTARTLTVVGTVGAVIEWPIDKPADCEKLRARAWNSGLVGQATANAACTIKTPVVKAEALQTWKEEPSKIRGTYDPMSAG
jgi:hypothetical protein